MQERHLYYALGNTPTEKKFIPRSVPTSELISRLESILPSINRDIVNFCAIHLERRNNELHSGIMAFSNMGTSKWLADFYLTCRELLIILDETMEKFLGLEESISAKSLIEALEDNSAKEVLRSIDAHKLTWNEKDEYSKKNLIEKTNIQSSKESGHIVDCPSCGCKSILHGTPYKSPTQSLEEDSIVEKQIMLPSSFECKACNLKIIGFRKLNACGLGDTFISTSYYDPSDYFGYDSYDNDIYSGFDDDNNEPF